MTELKPGYRIGPYVISKTLPGGKGGMAYAYVANRHLEKDIVQEVVLKMMKVDVADSQTQEFFSEAINNEVETLKMLHHPHIVHLYPIAWGSRRNPYIARVTTLPSQPWFYVMEYLKGGSVKHLLQNHKSLPVELSVEIIYQISLALDFMHSRGVSHLDIKPENVLLRYPLQEGFPLEAVLIDFGIARRKQVHTLAGSLPFMPPERVKVLKGAVPPENMGKNEPVDVYGLGVTLFQMLTGKLPFSGRTKSSITTAILNQTPTAPSVYNRDVPPPLDEAVWRMLAKDPRDRPAASEIPLMLDEAISPPRFVFRPHTSSEKHETAEGATATGIHKERSGKRWKILSALLLVAAISEAVIFSPVVGSALRKHGYINSTSPTTVTAATPTSVHPDTPTYTPTVAPTKTFSAERAGAVGLTPTPLYPTDTPIVQRPTSTPIPTFTPAPTVTPIP